MKVYIIKVAAAALLSALCDVITPKGYRKYVNILTNAILLLTLISPVLSFRNIEIPSFGKEEIKIREFDTQTEILSDLSKRIEADIEERLLTEFNFSAEAYVTLDSENTENVKVKEIVLSKKPTDAIYDRLYFIYECEVIKP
ncbi:MAG: hypothetical protein Q4B31_01545 [Clostridia bacterium]|nr:hypothetical protein [Clostridia bacterium]